MLTLRVKELKVVVAFELLLVVVAAVVLLVKTAALHILCGIKKEINNYVF